MKKMIFCMFGIVIMASMLMTACGHEHEYGEWTITTPATCTEDGVEERTCTKGDDTETRAIPATGHNFGDWNIVKEATYISEGQKERRCSLCGETETESISELIVDYAALQVGDIIRFGEYDCRVLEVQEDKALLITDEIVAVKGFYRIQNDPEHPDSFITRSSTVWEESTLREYLNGEFYDSFDDDSKSMILLTLVINGDFDPDNYFSVDAGPDTEDYIFCLSMDEAYNYFDGLNDRVAKPAEGIGERWWWLRTPGQGSNWSDGSRTYVFQFVDDKGEVQEYGTGLEKEIGVRPAFWIDTTN
jgi:hypothetical protein